MQTEDKYVEVYGIAKNALRDLRLMNGKDCEAALGVIQSHIGKKAMVRQAVRALCMQYSYCGVWSPNPPHNRPTNQGIQDCMSS